MKSIHYIDPGKKLVDGVADWLCANCVRETASGVKSMAHALVVVPTAQSGRRLRLALARRAAANGWGGILPPCVAMTSALLSGEEGCVATEAVELSTFGEVLMGADLSDFPVLFPRAPEERTMRWALDMAEGLLAIPQVLGEGAIFAHEVECDTESDRWRDIAKLEGLFHSALKRKGFVSRLEARRAAADAGCRIDGIEKIVLPGLVDAQPALVKYLGNSSQDIAVLVHADAQEASRFDEWGRPSEYFAAPVDPCSIYPPDKHRKEAESELIDEAVDKHAPCDNAVAFTVFGGDSDKFAEYGFDSPRSFEGGFAFGIVDSAMEHTVKVERLFVGEQRKYDVCAVTEDIGNQHQFIAVYRELIRIYLPYDIRMERR